MTPEDLSTALDAAIPQTLADLADLIAIPSVSSLPEHDADVERSATWAADKLRELGAADVVIVAAGGKPAVIAHFPAPEGQPTVCLYAHHDVQPIGDPDGWTTPAYQADVRDGRMFGRGAADDKGGVVAHLAALRAWGGKPPVGVTVFIEGEEEIGSPSLRALLDAHRDELAADAYVITDSGNWEVGVPTFTATLRGVVDCVVEVRTLDHGVHSGGFGGVVPDALMALSRLLASLHDDAGTVAVAGLSRSQAPDLDYPLDRLAEETGKLPGVEWIGDGSVVQRIWSSPALSILGIDTTTVAAASNTIIPSARAKVSLRIPPGQDPEAALAALEAHLRAHAPWGAQVSITDGSMGHPGVVRLEGPVYDAMVQAMTDVWGVAPVHAGQGGSIPMVADFQEVFPDATVLVTAVMDPDSRCHGLDESVHLGDLRNAALAEALLLARLTR